MREKMFRSPLAATPLKVVLTVVIIGLLVGVAIVLLGRRSAEAKKVTVRRQIDAYKTALGLYELDNGFYPTTEQGLLALIVKPTTPPVPNNWRGPYLDPPALRKDPWGHDYIYIYPGARNPSGYDLFSVGPNGAQGDDDDIGNWQ
ncbi:MAG: type II secretion system major pseudopilin GspG [Verrucomicrobiae bacterium]|nr:type II secretion system major pseudopilin GspG [Verrucomicrobiae bacterium]